jgi:hypothetical protein
VAPRGGGRRGSPESGEFADVLGRKRTGEGLQPLGTRFGWLVGPWERPPRAVLRRGRCSPGLARAWQGKERGRCTRTNEKTGPLYAGVTHRTAADGPLVSRVRRPRYDVAGQSTPRHGLLSGSGRGVSGLAASCRVLASGRALALEARTIARTPRQPGARVDAARRGAVRRGVAPDVSVRRRSTAFSQNFWIEVQYVVNRKFVDPITLYNFHKGRLVFFSTDFAGTSCQLWMSPRSAKQEMLTVDRVFHQLPLKIWNANLHESCVPQQDGHLS